MHERRKKFLKKITYSIVFSDGITIDQADCQKDDLYNFLEKFITTEAKVLCIIANKEKNKNTRTILPYSTST